MAGRIAYYGSIVTNGLVLFLDSAKKYSYPSIGTLWNDITINKNNATLINGPTFNFNNGSIVFDGINDYGTIPYTSNFNLSNTDYTLEGWFNSNSFSSGQVVISKDTFGANFDWALYMDNSTTLRYFSNGTSTSVTAIVPSMSINTWYQYTVTSISGIIRIYLNSVLYQTQSMSTSNANLNFITIGCAGWNNPNTFMNGRISVLTLYRRGLSASEILQNYNAIKTRYI